MKYVVVKVYDEETYPGQTVDRVIGSLSKHGIGAEARQVDDARELVDYAEGCLDDEEQEEKT